MPFLEKSTSSTKLSFAHLMLKSLLALLFFLLPRSVSNANSNVLAKTLTFTTNNIWCILPIELQSNTKVATFGESQARFSFSITKIIA